MRGCGTFLVGKFLLCAFWYSMIFPSPTWMYTKESQADILSYYFGILKVHKVIYDDTWFLGNLIKSVMDMQRYVNFKNNKGK